MLDEIILARMMTSLDSEFEKAMHYHNEGYESDNNHGLPPQVIRPVHVYSVFTTGASFILAECKETQPTISPFKCNSLPFCEGVCQCLTFDEVPPPVTKVDSDNEEYLLSAQLDDPMWSKELVPDSQEYLL